jgi:hypothetical protein
LPKQKPALKVRVFLVVIDIAKIPAPALRELALYVKELVFVPAVEGIFFGRFRIENSLAAVQLDNAALTARYTAVDRHVISK